MSRPTVSYTLVTNESDNSISVIDTKTLKEVSHIVVGKRPRDAAFTPDGKFAYVTGEFDNSVYRISVPGGAPVERIVQLDANARPMSVRLDLQAQSALREHRAGRKGCGDRCRGYAEARR